MRRLLAACGVLAGAVAFTAAPAGAIAAGAHGGTSSHGVGFCVVYVTPNPSEGTGGEIGFDRLGHFMQTVAPGGGTPALLAEIRYPSCGGPSAGE